MPATYFWRSIEEDNNQLVHSTEWEGPGWYATTRSFPGTEIYSTWKIPNSWGNMNDIRQRDNVSRSVGGSVRYLEEKPAE